MQKYLIFRSGLSLYSGLDSFATWRTTIKHPGLTLPHYDTFIITAPYVGEH